MVDVSVDPKLKIARRIIVIVTGRARGADELLQKADWDVKAAIVMQKNRNEPKAAADSGRPTILSATRSAKTPSSGSGRCSTPTDPPGLIRRVQPDRSGSISHTSTFA
jgi:hypothetical protein